MDQVPPGQAPYAPRPMSRSRVVACLIMVCAALTPIVVGPWVKRSLAVRRYVQGGAAAGYEYYLVGNPADVSPPTRPGIVLEGGGTDIDESFRWMIDRSGGGDFLVLRTSGTDAYNDDVFDLVATSGRCADSVATLIVSTRAASFDPFVVATIRSAEALWLAGGDQSLHYARWRGTPVADAIHDRIARGVPVGGTSSGLAVMGEFVYTAEGDAAAGGDTQLTSGIALGDPHHPRVTVRRDFLHLPYLDGVILEPHFLQESRHGRMAAFLARMAADNPGREARGIGIDRKTALLVEPDGIARVIVGPDHPFGRVVLLRMTGRAEVCEPGRALSAASIEVREFGAGDRIDLLQWSGAGGTLSHFSINEGRPTMTRRTRSILARPWFGVRPLAATGPPRGPEDGSRRIIAQTVGRPDEPRWRGRKTR
jgi:cyanophycinase